jgi:hypothetical protein
MSFMKKSGKSSDGQSDSSREEDFPCDLVFPDWSGMKHLSKRLSLEDGFRMCEEYMASGLMRGGEARRIGSSIFEEFVL